MELELIIEAKVHTGGERRWAIPARSLRDNLGPLPHISPGLQITYFVYYFVNVVLARAGENSLLSLLYQIGVPRYLPLKDP